MRTGWKTQGALILGYSPLLYWSGRTCYWGLQCLCTNWEKVSLTLGGPLLWVVSAWLTHGLAGREQVGFQTSLHRSQPVQHT